MNEYNYFGFHKLNMSGQEKAIKIQQLFETLQRELSPNLTGHPRAAAVVMAKLEEACFYAKKCMATDTINQEVQS
jgi:hypothetical protein